MNYSDEPDKLEGCLFWIAIITAPIWIPVYVVLWLLGFRPKAKNG